MVVEGGEQVGAVPAGGDGVLHAPHAGVAEALVHVAHVAGEAAVAEEGLDAVRLGGVDGAGGGVGGAEGRGRGVEVEDLGVEAGGQGVGGEGLVEESGELGVGLDQAR